jgi:hypothetical protein
MVEQAYALWLSLITGDALPAAEAILQHPDCSFADLAIMVDLDAKGADAPLLSRVGERLPSRPEQLPIPLGEVDPRSLISRLTAHYLEPIANRAPIGFEAEFTDSDNNAIAYSAIGLPCASDGQTIDAMLGFISFELLHAPISASGVDPLADSRTAEGGGEAIATAAIPEETESVVARAARITSAELRRIVMSYEGKIDACMEIEGALAVALVDMDSGMALATAGGTKGLDLEVAAAGNTNVLKAKLEVMQELGIKGDIEDMMITLDDQIHLIRPNTTESGKGLFMYLALAKAKANLAMARHKLRNIEKGLEV